MQASKTFRNVENLFADSIKKSVNFVATRYGDEDDVRTRAWITYDKEIIFDANTFYWIIISQGIVTKDIIQTSYNNKNRAQSYDGLHSYFTFFDSLEEYLTLPIEEALHSENILIRALAMFDRRLGKRRLEKLYPLEEEHELVKKFFQFRRNAENMGVPFSPQISSSINQGEK